MTQTNVDNLKDLIRLFGGTPKGDTVAALLDELEAVAPTGGTATESAMRQAIERWVEDHVGHVTDADIDGIFGD